MTSNPAGKTPDGSDRSADRKPREVRGDHMHTPTPWIAAAHFRERAGAREYIPIVRPGNDPVPIAVVHISVDGYGREEGDANAAFIVRAVNAYEANATALATQDARIAELEAFVFDVSLPDDVGIDRAREHVLRSLVREYRDKARTLKPEAR